MYVQYLQVLFWLDALLPYHTCRKILATAESKNRWISGKQFNPDNMFCNIWSGFILSAQY